MNLHPRFQTNWSKSKTANQLRFKSIYEDKNLRILWFCTENLWEISLFHWMDCGKCSETMVLKYLRYPDHWPLWWKLHLHWNNQLNTGSRSTDYSTIMHSTLYKLEKYIRWVVRWGTLFEIKYFNIKWSLFIIIWNQT